MNGHDAFASAIDCMYAAATGDTPWEPALAAILQATGYDGAAFYVFDRSRFHLNNKTEAFVRGVWHELDPGGQDDYAAHYFRIDPRLQYALANPGARVLHDYLHTAEAEIDRHPYYAWHLRNQYTRYYLGGQVAPNLPFFGALTLHRRAALGPAREDEIARFTPLFAHLERALMVEYRLHRAGLAAAEGEALVERNAAGLVLLDANGGVLHSNAAARAMAARADAFALGNTVRALRPVDDGPLQSLIGQAVAPAPPKTPPDALRLPRRCGGRDYAVIVVPTARGAQLFAPWSPAALLLMIIDPQDPPTAPERQLRAIFGLTPAEARVLATLARGETIERAAELLAISLPTARSHLAAIFRKTRTRRQAELMRLIAALPWDMLRVEA